MRLDQYLVSNQLVASRARAQRLIAEEKVEVNGLIITKSSHKIKDADNVKLLEPDFKWVSRGAFKLLRALDFWLISPKDKNCLDVGASTGGFTEVLLDNEAQHVWALDVGHGQIVDSLRKNDQVTVLEKIDIRNFEAPKKFDLVTIDVSFISLKLVLPVLPKLLSDSAEVICLIKPQFEVGPENINTRGLVKEAGLYQKVIDHLVETAEGLGFAVQGVTGSPIEGGDGNKEFLMYAKWSATKT